MKRVASITILGLLLLGTGCGRRGDGADGGEIGIYSKDAFITSKDYEELNRLGGATTQTTATTETKILTEEALYNPSAKIQVDMIAGGSYGLPELLAEARKTEAKPYEAAIVQIGLKYAMAGRDAGAAREQFGKEYGALLDYLRGRGMKVIAGEALPILEYQKRSYPVPAAEINELIEQLNHDLAGLAFQKADGLAFTHRIFRPRANLDFDSLLLNKKNSGLENGVQPTFAGMRLLGQLYAHALHELGYRGGAILVLGDSTLSNEALTRAIHKFPFLLTKYLEIELYKTCP